MSPYLVGGGMAVLFGAALLRIWGLQMTLDVLLSPVRRYDFDEDPAALEVKDTCTPKS